MRSASRTIVSLAVLLVAAGCAPKPPARAESGEATALTACKEPRPEMCTREYVPVCAARDTGVRCITTPCPSEELREYGNACTACSDAKVHGYRPGPCESN